MREINKLPFGHIDFKYVEKRIKEGNFELNKFTFAEIQIHPVLYDIYLTKLKQNASIG